MYKARVGPCARRRGERVAFEALEGRRLLAAYSVIDLGTFGGAASGAFDINNANQVVGNAQLADGENRAFLFEDANGNGAVDAGEMVNLGVTGGFTHSFAHGLNEAGVVVGYVANGTTSSAIKRAVRFAGANSATDLGLGDGSLAYEINAGGGIVGGATFGSLYTAFYRNASGVVKNLGTLGSGQSRYSEAFAINDQGVIAGYSGAMVGDTAFVYSGNGPMTPIGFSGQTGLTAYDYAWDINSNGQIVGDGFDSTGTYQAFLYQSGAITPLGMLAGATRSSGLDLNNLGQVVGRAQMPSGGFRAFVYRDGQMFDLNDLIPAGSGWTLTAARAINDQGYIVGTGVNAAGQTHAFMLAPVTPPVVVAGTGGDDVIVLRRSVADAGVVEVLVNSQTPTMTFRLSDVPQVSVEAGGGNDRMVFDGVEVEKLSIDGGAGEDAVEMVSGTHHVGVDVRDLAVERLVAGGDASVVLKVSQHVGSVSVEGGGSLTLEAGGTRVLRASAVSVSGEGRLDLADNALVVEGAGQPEAVLQAISMLIASARNGETLWGGAGITSSAAAGGLGMTLAAVVNDDGAGNPLVGQIGGEAVTADAVLVRYAITGDVNLDGRVTAGDYFAIDRGRALGLDGYARGDFDYVGSAGTADDYMLIDRAFLSGAAPQATAAVLPPAVMSGGSVGDEEEEEEEDGGHVWDG